MPKLQLDFWAVTLPYKNGEEVFAGDPHVRDIHGHELYNFEDRYFGSYFGCGKSLFLDPFQANAFLVLWLRMAQTICKKPMTQQTSMHCRSVPAGRTCSAGT